VGLSGCATLVNGSNQSVTVVTDPPGASCILSRQGETIGAIAATPGSVQISKSKNDVSVACEKAGFVTATVAKSPDFGGATFANILAGGVVGIVVDAASGANYTYPSEIHVPLAPIQPVVAPQLLVSPVTQTGVAVPALQGRATSVPTATSR
jgi:hypothetical protein